MNILSAILLGIVQGLTEFLPVSSSGHLVLVQKLIPEFTQPGVLFDVLLHFGTLFAVVVYFKTKLLKLSPKYIGLLFVGTLPAVVIGLVLKDFLESSYSVGGIVLALQFLLTAFFCFWIDRLGETEREVTYFDSLVIGLFQALAILPAVSRSGATIFVAVTRGIDRKKAAEFSFLLSIPAILGANVLEILSFKEGILPVSPVYFAGFLASFIIGFATIGFTIKLLAQRKFKVFSVYTLILAVISIFIN